MFRNRTGGRAAAALMFDIDSRSHHRYLQPHPDERRVAVHSMISF